MIKIAMSLDKSHQYLFRMGSQNQIRLFWNGAVWHYEFLAGGVLFDEQSFSTEEELTEALSMHGLSPEKFSVDTERTGEAYSQAIKSKIQKLEAAGITPCPKHGLVSKNMDGSCEACINTDFPDDHKGTEG
jgi:hypothetical protein